MHAVRGQRFHQRQVPAAATVFSTNCTCLMMTVERRRHAFQYLLHNSLSSGDAFQLLIISDYLILAANLHRKFSPPSHTHTHTQAATRFIFKDPLAVSVPVGQGWVLLQYFGGQSWQFLHVRSGIFITKRTAYAGVREQPVSG